MSNSRNRRARPAGTPQQMRDIHGLLNELNDAQSTLNSMQASLAQTVSGFVSPANDSGSRDETLAEALAQLSHVPDELTQRVEQLRTEVFEASDHDRTVTVVLTESCTNMDLRMDAQALAGVPTAEVARRIIEAHTAAAAGYRKKHQETQDWTDQAAAPLHRYADKIGVERSTATSS